MRRLRIGDKVQVITGDDKGKIGVVKRLIGNDRILVEGVNKMKKHIKKGVLGKNQKGGIFEIEAPIHISNVMLVCPHCGKPTRVEIAVIDGKKMRVCKKCGKPIDKKAKVKGKKNAEKSTS